MNRRDFLVSASMAVIATQLPDTALAQTPAAPGEKKGLLLMNRIGPSTAELYVANADGTGERKFLQDSKFEYNPSFSPDGKSVVFTSERNGDGNPDLFRCAADGTGIEQIVAGPSVEDAGTLSPDGTRLAFVSTRNGYRANIWIRDTARGEMANLTGNPDIQGDLGGPTGFFRPAWSPDGRWLAFSSDRNTDWRGHDGGKGWEHTQELSIYVIGADGKNFRRIASKPGYCLGSPNWSPDGKRVVFYEMTTEDTWGARRPNLVGRVVSQIVSVDVATGERQEHTTGPGLKISPQYLSATEIAYHRKGGADEGLYYTSGRPSFKATLRSPAWSPDGKTVIYEKLDFKPRPQNKQLYSWYPEWEYRHTDVFPILSRDGKLIITEKAQNSSIGLMDPDGSNRKRIFEASSAGLDPAKIRVGLAGAFHPTVSPDGQWIAFGLGEWFQARNTGTAKLMRVRRDGTDAEALTDGSVHSGFPSFSADGKELVYRVWGENNVGLRILDVESKKSRVLTTQYDNLPDWSPDGSRILFTRRVDDVNFDIFTIRPDGSDLTRLTSNRSGDGHAVWTADGKIMWNSGMYGFRDEAALYDNTFQQYGQIFIMNADGTGKRMLTDSRWEDSMPLYVPSSSLSNFSVGKYDHYNAMTR